MSRVLVIVTIEKADAIAKTWVKPKAHPNNKRECRGIVFVATP